MRVAALRSEVGELLGLSMVCRKCGCTEWAPCMGGCGWVPSEIDLCTTCLNLFLIDVDVAMEAFKKANVQGVWTAR